MNLKKVKHSDRNPIWRPMWIPGPTILDGHNHWRITGYRNTDTNVYCCECNRYTIITNMYADLDGKPFQSYYCKFCKQRSEE